MNKLVSIIIPVYNREDMVSDAIISSLNQDYKNIEIILIDDGSNDNSLKIMQSFAKNNSSIKTIHQENKGAQQARITGLNHANGDYITFLDSDDVINKQYISGLIKAQSYNDANITIARIHQYVILNNHLLHLIYKKYPKTFTIEKRKDILPTIWVGNTAKLFKRNALELKDYGLIANEDLAINYHNYIKNQIMAANNKSIYTIRPAKNSLAENYIRQNIAYINNTLKPLEIEKKLFIESKYFIPYYSELEAIFIHNITERINNIDNYPNISINQKNELIKCLLSYLNYNFPNWKNNKYYKIKFINSSIYSIYFALTTMKSINNNNTNDILDYESTIETYQKILKK